MKNKFKVLVPFLLLFLLAACEDENIEENIEEDPCGEETTEDPDMASRPHRRSHGFYVHFKNPDGTPLYNWYSAWHGSGRESTFSLECESSVPTRILPEFPDTHCSDLYYEVESRIVANKVESWLYLWMTRSQNFEVYNLVLTFEDGTTGKLRLEQQTENEGDCDEKKKLLFFYNDQLVHEAGEPFDRPTSYPIRVFIQK